MTTRRPSTIAAYLRAAPRAGQPHLRRLHAILADVAPHAEAVIKWNTPFFVEPRFLFAYSAFKAHLSLAPVQAALDAHRGELGDYAATRRYLKVRYDQPLPEALIRRIAQRCVRLVRERADDAFW